MGKPMMARSHGPKPPLRQSRVPGTASASRADSNSGRIGVGSSGGLVLPEPIIAAIRDGRTLEQAIDAAFGTEKIGQGIGMFGLMTKGVVTRTSGVEHGVAFALARFLHGDLYGQNADR
jgi:non-canonical (house-cleaning) NTP pyrophosphatase